MDIIKFDREKTKSVIEEYYKKYEDFDGCATINVKNGSVGYGMSEHTGAMLDIKMRGSLEVLGQSVLMERVILEDDLKNIFRCLLEDSGASVGEVSIDYGINSETVGYGLSEHSVKKAYFNGVSVSLLNKKLVR